MVVADQKRIEDKLTQGVRQIGGVADREQIAQRRAEYRFQLVLVGSDRPDQERVESLRRGEPSQAIAIAAGSAPRTQNELAIRPSGPSPTSRSPRADSIRESRSSGMMCPGLRFASTIS